MMKMLIENKLFFLQIEIKLFRSTTIDNHSHQTNRTVMIGLLKSMLKAISYWF